MPDQGLDQTILGLSAVSEYIEGLLKRQELLKAEPEEQRLITFTTPEGITGQRLVGERELIKGVITKQPQNRLEELKGQIKLHEALTGEDVTELEFIKGLTEDEFGTEGELALAEEFMKSKRTTKAPTFANITDAAVGKWMRGQPLSDKEQILVNKKLKEGSQEVQDRFDIAINKLSIAQGRLELPPTVRAELAKEDIPFDPEHPIKTAPFRKKKITKYFAVIDGKEKEVTKDRYNFYIAQKAHFDKRTIDLQRQIDELQAKRDELGGVNIDPLGIR